MLYFLINNNYHLYDVRLHLSNLTDESVGLIQIPHKLDIVSDDTAFVNIEVFDKLLRSGGDYVNFIRSKRLRNEIHRKISVKAGDVLFVYTEYELLNQCIIEHFKMSGALVYLMEEGFATYTTFLLPSDRIPLFSERVKLFLVRQLLGYKQTKFLYLNNMSFPQIEDSYIDGVVLYRDVEVIRKINKIVIAKSVEQILCDNNESVIFLNEKMYDHYLPFNEYLVMLRDILINLSKYYNKVYFKFHPRENLERQNQVLPIISGIAGLELIKDDTAIENIITRINTKNIASFFSAALLNLYDAGLNPIYVFHKYDILMKQNMFIKVKKILLELGYNFFEDWTDLSNEFVGFKKQPCSSKSGIRDLI